MGDLKGFLNIKRKIAGYRPVEERINDYSEVELQLSDDESAAWIAAFLSATGRALFPT